MRSYKSISMIAVAVVIILSVAGVSFAQDLQDFERNLTEFTLDNGMKFLVYERHEAPVVSFNTNVNVGAADETKGITGIAHILEHMAFKGTRTVGTTDYLAEQEAMRRTDELFMMLKAERARFGGGDPERLKELETQFADALAAEEAFSRSDEFDKAMDGEGAVGLNASTSRDYTQYYVSLPSNKVELWMSLESDRFFEPVFRDFYKERNVVMEERRMRVESNPIGRLLEEFLAVAYKAHPYGEPLIGHMSDLETLTRQEVKDFFARHYTPTNMTIAIVGDVDPVQIREMVETYFGRIPRGVKPEPVETVEPPQLGEKLVTIDDPSQPFVVIGYHKPDIRHPDNAVFDAITDIMAIGRTSRLYKSLVKERKIAANASGLSGYPGEKYPNLFVFYAFPAKDHTNEECEQAIYEEIEKLKTEPVSEDELRKARTRSRAALIRQLDSNSGLASLLCYYETLTGDWRNLFIQLEKIDQVTAEDIRRVANEYFVDSNKTVAKIVTRSNPDVEGGE